VASRRDSSGKFVRIHVDWKKIEAELGDNLKRGQTALDLQVLKDCDPYVPYDSGNLRNSGIRATKPGEGQVIWDAPYAFAQYNGAPRKSHDVHPQAVLRWFEAAKAVRKDAWLRVAKRLGGGGK
jgi:hypothetical protein